MRLARWCVLDNGKIARRMRSIMAPRDMRHAATNKKKGQYKNKSRQKGGCPSSQYTTQLPLSLCRSPFVAVLLVLQRKLFVRLRFLPGEIVAARGAALVYAGRPGIVDLAARV